MSMMLKKRLAAYSHVSTELALLSNHQLINLLEDVTPLGTGIGGNTSILKINNTTVFVKKIPLTDIELQPKNILSTRNIFDLPMYCQYGIGSPGFGVWREVAAHIMSTNWVIAGECPNFPLMYHWRVLPSPVLSTNEMLNRDSAYLNGIQEVRQRIQAIQTASNSIVIFLEYFPHNVHQWFAQELSKNNTTAEAACMMVEKNLKTITAFINSHDLLHFDAHFWNILTDGRQLYFSDFGLAISSKFELSDAEIDFFKKNHRYDQCYTMAHLAKWLLIECVSEDNWKSRLHEYLEETVQENIPSTISTAIMRYAPLSITMNDFFERLKIAPESTSYPSEELDRLYTIAVQ